MDGDWLIGGCGCGMAVPGDITGCWLVCRCDRDPSQVTLACDGGGCGWRPRFWVAVGECLSLATGDSSIKKAKKDLSRRWKWRGLVR